MAQLRQDYQQFRDRGVKVIILGPDGPKAFQRFWQEEEMPFTGLADIKSVVADKFYQEVNLLKFGRMPAVFVIDKKGNIRYKHYGASMADIPETAVVLEALDQLIEEENG